ncbi:MAG: TonB-dependent receptor family protein [Halothiobacillaceae bacterium]
MLAALGLLAGPAAGDETRLLSPVTLTAPGLERPADDYPAAFSWIDHEDMAAGRSLLQPTDALSHAPGVLVQNRHNFAQNPRVSIRGFGSRAPFGIRGIRLRLDRIPLTTVDGQSQTDLIDPRLLERIEVIRGANAVYEGNASGGLIDFHTVDPTRNPAVAAGIMAGSHGLRQAHGRLTTSQDQLTGTLSATGLELAGARANARVRRANAALRLVHRGPAREHFLALYRLDNPRAEDPGGLTRAQWKQDRNQAAPLAARMNAGQRVRQTLLATGFEWQGESNAHGGARLWLTRRDFRQQLPFPGDSLVSYARQSWGVDLARGGTRAGIEWRGGLSLARQEDERNRHCRSISLQPEPCRSGRQDDLALDQRERAENLGLRLELSGRGPGGRWTLGLRHDRLRMSIDDHLKVGGLDRSGNRDYGLNSYSLGYGKNLGRGWFAFAHYATSFEAPTFTEFANPAGSGFRPGLTPQRARSLEAGLRGQGANHQLELTLFAVRVRDEIIVDDNPGAAPDDERSFYRNADRTRRVGAELDARWWPDPLPGLGLQAVATVMDARFERDQKGRLPGLPTTSLLLDAEYRAGSGRFGGLTARYIGPRYADDANTTRVAGQTVVDLRLGQTLRGVRGELELFLGIDNLFDRDALDNLRVNARNGRYYEPAPGRTFHAGLNWRHR